MRFINCVLLLALSFMKMTWTQNYECVNPQQMKGVCLPIQSCIYVLNIARLTQNAGAQNFVRQSHCGYNGYTLYVCCPQATQLMPTQTQNQQQISGKILPPVATLPKPPTCGVDSENRIFGGTSTNVYEFPWLALLKYTKPGSANPVFSCSGTLISDRYVLTAAHCVHSKIIQRTQLIGVRLGEWNLSTNPDCDESFVNEKVCNDPVFDVGIEQQIIHDKYLPQSFNQHNDIALLRMSQKVRFSEFIKPICLPSASSENLIGKALTVVGFGKTETALSSNVKLKAFLSVVDIEKCNQVFRFEGRKAIDTQICAGGVKNVDSCRGDSGGPLMQFVTNNRISYWMIAGIVSYGPSPCGQENKPGVYTKVASFVSWIEGNVKS